MELSQLIQQLPPEQLGRMQTLMHNVRGGHDVRTEVEAFERALPPGFREKMLGILMKSSTGVSAPVPEAAVEAPPSMESSPEMNLREARLTILRGVADGSVAPEEAERLLFSN